MPAVPRPFPLAALFAVSLFAQDPAPGSKKAEADVLRIARKDPYTEEDPKAMAALGLVAYGPLPWGDGRRTDDVDKVLGESRILWFETAHFRLGCNLTTIGMPQDPEVRRLLGAELKRLHDKWARLPERTSKLDPWLRAHLYAQRAEELYADFGARIGHDEAQQPLLGAPDKFLLLLFQRRSDLARYLDRFCGKQSQFSQRHTHAKSGHLAFVLSAEADEVHDEAAVHAQFRFLLLQTLQGAARTIPYWLTVGLAHHYERQVPTNLIHCAPREDEHVDPQTQHKWEQKAKARAARDGLWLPFDELCTTIDLGYFGHVQAWSRVDWLLAQDAGKFRLFYAGLAGNGSSSRQVELLDEVYGLDPQGFDRAWREWVLKTYSK